MMAGVTSKFYPERGNYGSPLEVAILDGLLSLESVEVHGGYGYGNTLNSLWSSMGYLYL